MPNLEDREISNTSSQGALWVARTSTRTHHTAAKAVGLVISPGSHWRNMAQLRIASGGPSGGTRRWASSSQSRALAPESGSPFAVGRALPPREGASSGLLCPCVRHDCGDGARVSAPLRDGSAADGGHRGRSADDVERGDPSPFGQSLGRTSGRSSGRHSLGNTRRATRGVTP